MSDTESEDEQLNRAIALSLQDQYEVERTAAGSGKQVIDLISDDDASSGTETLVGDTARSPEPQSHGFLGLDRKAMEQERLARKRKPAISPPPLRGYKRLKEDAYPSVNEETLLSRRVQSELYIQRAVNSTHSITQTDPPNSPEVKYPKGVVKKTWAFGHPRQEDIKIEEVLERSDLTLAVLSSFVWDVEWLLRKLDLSSTRLIMVMMAKTDALKRQYEQDAAGMQNIRVCFPPMPGQVFCMHSKLMLLAHPSYLRIVVPTANLTPYDWGETAVMENMMFLIDLPRLPKTHGPAENLTFFGQELVYYLRAMGLQDDVLRSIYNFDFSQTSNLAFVHTIGGVHPDEDLWRRTGYCGLGRAIKELGLGTARPLGLDYVASSIGALTMDFLTMFYLAAQGNDGLKEYGWRTANSPSRRNEKEELIQNIEKHFRIYFPSRETVLNSTGGARSGGTICFESKWYNSPSFPRRLFRDCESKRTGMLMHNKVDSLFFQEWMED